MLHVDTKWQGRGVSDNDDDDDDSSSNDDDDDDDDDDDESDDDSADNRSLELDDLVKGLIPGKRGESGRNLVTTKTPRRCIVRHPVCACPSPPAACWT